MSFDLLPLNAKYIFSGVIFTVTAVQLILCMYRFALGSRVFWKVFDAILLALFAFLTAYLTAVSYGEYSFKAPWYVLLATTPLLTYSLYGIASEYRKSKRVLTPVSVKETIDDLDAGICFSDKNGKLILINYKMNALAYSALGAYPQTLDELLFALNEGGKVEVLDESLSIYKFDDGRVWRFTTSEIKDEGLFGFNETIALDVTAIRIENGEIEKQNERLKSTISELQRMYSRLADRVREEESLNLKMRLHDDVGASLIAISKLMQEGSTDLEGQLKKLREAVWYFADPRERTLDEVMKKAEDMRVKVLINGVGPNGKTGALIATAIETCVSNCVNHAKGSKVYADVIKYENTYIVTIKNDGDPPRCEIKEGGGLASLREAVENEGGEMSIAFFPEFVLTIKLPEKEEEL